MTCCDAEQVIFREMRKARSLELSVLRACERARNQRSKLLVRQGRKPQQAGVQPLELAFRHRVEVDAPNPLLGTRALQPTEKDLGSTGIGDCALAQTALDLRVRRRALRGCAVTPRAAGLHARGGTPSDVSCSRARTQGSRSARHRPAPARPALRERSRPSMRALPTTHADAPAVPSGDVEIHSRQLVLLRVVFVVAA